MPWHVPPFHYLVKKGFVGIRHGVSVGFSIFNENLTVHLMRRLLNVLKYIFLTIIALVVVLVLFLYVYYGVESRKIDRQQKQAMAAESKRGNPVLSPEMSKDPEGLNLLPVPKEVHFLGGTTHLPARLTFSVPAELKSVAEHDLGAIPGTISNWQSSGGLLTCLKDTSLKEQAYELKISPSSIGIRYSSSSGLHYALVSLKVLAVNYRNAIPCLEMKDAPDMKVRGLMLDISRNKIPSVETLLSLVNMLADLKYNHLELYVEGFSFAYPSFTKLWEDSETPLTGADIRKVDSLCRLNFIDLVPNQNSLGHMNAWLATDEYKDLAECPNGYKMFGLITMKTTMDPGDPRSLALVDKMTDDLLPNFTSASFNVNLDEPFELGEGKSKKICKEKGVANVYLDYALKLHEKVTARKKKMLMWGDVGLRHPETLKRIPADITLLDWGYEAMYPFERNGKNLQDAHVKYYVCPGTSSWTTITGRTENMLGNISHAVNSGMKYGASGMLLTDWGDMGHWQYLPVSYAGYVTGAALSWNAASQGTFPLQRFLDTYIFRDSSSKMGGLVLNAGRYNHYEEFKMMNMTTTMLAFQFGLQDKVMINAVFGKILKGITGMMRDLAPNMIDTVTNAYNNRISYDYKGLNTFLDKQTDLLRQVHMKVPDSSLVRQEYLNAFRLIRLGSEVKRYIVMKDEMSKSAKLQSLGKMDSLCTSYLAENKKLWLARNHPGGYDTSTASLVSLQNDIRKKEEIVKGSFMKAGFNRFLEKISSAGIALYMKLS
jgi:hexosaminidase